MKKYYRFVNTEAGELPVVGDELYMFDTGEWHRIHDNDIPNWVLQPEDVIRRELHPQEMAKEIAKVIQANFIMKMEIGQIADYKIAYADVPNETIESVILPHIQAALEGKG